MQAISTSEDGSESTDDLHTTSPTTTATTTLTAEQPRSQDTLLYLLVLVTLVLYLFRPLVALALLVLIIATVLIVESTDPDELAGYSIHTITDTAWVAIAHIGLFAAKLITNAVAWLGCGVLVVVRTSAIGLGHLTNPAHQQQVAVLAAIICALNIVYVGRVVISSLQCLLAFGYSNLALLITTSFSTLLGVFQILTHVPTITKMVGAAPWSEALPWLQWLFTAALVVDRLVRSCILPENCAAYHLICSACTG